MSSSLAYTERELIGVWSKNNNYLHIETNTIVSKKKKEKL